MITIVYIMYVFLAFDDWGLYRKALVRNLKHGQTLSRNMSIGRLYIIIRWILLEILNSTAKISQNV